MITPAKITNQIDNTAINQILKVISQPDMISLAGGLPDISLFPLDKVKETVAATLEKYGSACLQYGSTQGELVLRKSIAKFLESRDLKVTADNVFVSPGSQSVIDATAKVMLDPKDFVAIESPTYLTALKTFKNYNANFIEIETDNEGVIPSALEKAMKNKKVKFSYIMSTFQNPTGKTLSLERRKEIAKLAIKYDHLILEDDPYYDLRFSGDNIAPIYKFAPENVIYSASFSKTLAPGLRLGYFMGPNKLIEFINSVRQTSDICANTLSQYVAAEYTEQGYLAENIININKAYKAKMDLMFSILSKSENFKLTKPDGGMFLWLEFKQDFDVQQLHKKLISRKVAVVDGTNFFANISPKTPKAIRLNFTAVSLEKIEKATKIVLEEINLAS